MSQQPAAHVFEAGTRGCPTENPGICRCVIFGGRRQIGDYGGGVPDLALHRGKRCHATAFDLLPDRREGRFEAGRFRRPCRTIRGAMGEKKAEQEADQHSGSTGERLPSPRVHRRVGARGNRQKQVWLAPTHPVDRKWRRPRKTAMHKERPRAVHWRGLASSPA